MDYEEMLAEETLKLLNNDTWFTETIGVDGYGSGHMTEAQTIRALRAAYLDDDGDQFLRVVKSYARPAFLGVAEAMAHDRMAKEALHKQECIDARADGRYEIWKDEQDSLTR